ncbi:MAG: hypothetical protein JXR46_06215 [Calditrichaceae bacterium]|nr:hypothetical protein [Calditrichaceae bacterium]MBN2708621.1 hypothetical protein [Calditrichaceae bacterium]RQV95471.1 MAG: hypothetical protein EH224_07575 [Calditrichota bacterium]
MNSNAPGSFLGYSMQVPRALFHLLTGSPGDIVCVEILGDVTSLSSDDHTISEEDKASTDSNPLTDRSINLWKTFYNWINAVNSGEMDIQKTIFILYTNKAGRPGLVNHFDSAVTKEDAQKVITEAKQRLKDINHDHVIWSYYDYVVNKNEILLSEVILKFELQIGSGAGYDEVEQELVRKNIYPKQIPHLINNLAGWLQIELTERIAARKPARIEWDDFDRQIKVLFHRIRCLELIDFTLREAPDKDEIQQQVKVKPRYLKQLDAINLDSDDIIKAVSDFLRAKVNRDKWIENEIIDENVAREFQEKLVSFWANQKKRIEITQKKLNDEDRGHLLFLECSDRQETIRDMNPPVSTIPGTYHALADEPVLGWHRNWENLFQKNKDS